MAIPLQEKYTPFMTINKKQFGVWDSKNEPFVLKVRGTSYMQKMIAEPPKINYEPSIILVGSYT